MNGVLDHLQSIEDFVLVEDKIVTYKWISKTLKVHVNTAKQLLHAFATKKELDKKLLVTYLISGQGKNESGVKFCLVNKEDIDKVEHSFEKVICEHVYSVQRNNSFDAKDLYNADCTYELNEEDRRYCSIKKNEEDIVKRCRKLENSNIFVDSSNDKTSKGLHKNGAQNKSEKIISASNVKSTKSKVESTKPLQEKSAAITEKPSPVKETKFSPVKQGTKNKKIIKNAPSKDQSIGTFFNKQAALAVTMKKQTSKDILDKEKEEAKENIVVANKNRNTDSDDKNHFEQIAVPKKKENTKKRKKRDKDYESTNKKRKRIMIASDSESSCSEMELDEDREPSPEPEIEPVALAESEDEIIPPTPEVKGRKKVRKQVDRTFKGEDGFLWTKKEDVYESCTDDEAPIGNKTEKDDKKPETTTNKTSDNKTLKGDNKMENNKNKKEKRKSSPKKTPPKNKQQSIMSFFRKK